MADIVKTRKTLSLQAKFADEDTRTITLDNPKNGLTAAQIKAVDGNTIIGDKAGAAFVRWETAKIVNATTTYYDIA